MTDQTTTPEDDSLRDALEGVFDEKATEEVDAPEVEVKSEEVSAEEPVSEANSDENQSLKEEIDKNSPKNEVKDEKKPFVEVEKPNQPPKDEEKTEEADYSTEKPPVGWKPAVREHWGELPDEVKHEVMRREREIDDRLRETTHERQLAQNFSKIMTPYRDLLEAQKATPIEAVQHLMQTVETLNKGDADTIADKISEVAIQYGINRFGNDFLVKFDKALTTQATSQNDPRIQRMQQQFQQELQPLKQMASQYQQMQSQEQAQHQQKLVEALNEFKQDHEYFDDVAPQVGLILKNAKEMGVQISLEDAYNEAVQRNPEIRSLLQKRAEKEQAKQHNETAQKARKASVSVRGNAPVSGTQQPQGSSLRDDLEFALNNISR